MLIDSDEKPRLVSAGQGFCSLNTVQYKNRFLYSKYNPDKAVLQTIQSLVILPQTLVIVCSPVLWYGIEQLLAKCDQTSCVIAYEADQELFTLAKESPHPQTVKLYRSQDLNDLDKTIRSAMQEGNFRRAIRVDLSAGVQFNAAQYEYVVNACEEIIANFWKSRITITRLGKLFAKNTLTNLAFLPKGKTLKAYEKTISKPILVCGAGESLDETIKTLTQKNLAQNFYIIAVDASFSALTDAGIEVQAVVAMESQFAIQNAYCGLTNKTVTLFADIVSRPQVTQLFEGTTVWFASRYANVSFLDSIINTFFEGMYFEPLGSVGLGAVKIALALRKNDTIPIYVSGLDFSYSAGRTHAKNTPAFKTQTNRANRITQGSVFHASFNEYSSLVKGKNNKTCFSTPSLLMYAKLFTQLFADKANVFDAGKTGCPLGLPQKDIDLVEKSESENVFTKETSLVSNEQIKSFYNTEMQALKQIRDLLSKGENSSYRDSTKPLNQQIHTLLQKREYLYLHFPDGYRLSMESSFLKRVRAELDSFIKIIEVSLRLFP
ncbi:MAG TPA: hypothetical protein DC014_04420 [Treponema sp.]|nr:hypothetical protein [Treponema sp.]